MSPPLTPRERKLKRQLRQLRRAIVHSGGVPKVKMQLADGSWAYGIFIPFESVEVREMPFPVRTSQRRIADLDLPRSRRVRSHVRRG